MCFLIFFSLLFSLAYAGDDKDVDEALAQKIISKNCDVNMQRSEIQELQILSRTFTCSKNILINFVTIDNATSEVAQFSLSAKNEKGYSVVLIEMEEQLYSQPLEKIIAKTKKNTVKDLYLFTGNIYKESKQFQAEKEAERIAKKKAEESKTKELTEKEKLIQSLI